MAKILIVDDEKSIRRTLRDILEFEKFEVDEARDGLDCLIKLKRQTYDVILLDIKMPNMDGMEVLAKIVESKKDIPIIMISGHANIDTAMDAIKIGAYDFVSKPPDLNRLLITVKNAIDRSNLVEEAKVLKRKVSKIKAPEIIGQSTGILEIKETVLKVGKTDARVLITGENGTGKELVARMLHENSNRKDGPLVEVNCAAIPSGLIESELFGHEKGAYTHAIKQRIGKFEQANGGTLFLDEIGDMSHSAQTKVLRALQESEITRVGGDKVIKVDVRIVAATNKNLREEIRKGNFREDLFHRLQVIPIHVPSLNDRISDIPLLVDHFISLICNEYGTSPKTITKEAIQLLQKNNWTGNIRELRNVVERLIILSKEVITYKDVENYVHLNSKENQLYKMFDKFKDFEELVDFLKKEFESYKQLM